MAIEIKLFFRVLEPQVDAVATLKNVRGTREKMNDHLCDRAEQQSTLLAANIPVYELYTPTYLEVNAVPARRIPMQSTANRAGRWERAKNGDESGHVCGNPEYKGGPVKD